QHLVGRPRHPRRIVGQHEIVPAEMVDQPVAGREVHPHRPFLGTDMRRPRRQPFEGIHDVLSLGQMTALLTLLVLIPHKRKISLHRSYIFPFSLARLTAENIYQDLRWAVLNSPEKFWIFFPC